MKISYYELLGMIKKGNIPKKLDVKLPNVNYSRTYYAEYDGIMFNCYFLLEVEDGDENYDVYLADCFLESNMFDKCITILDEEDDFEYIIKVNLAILNDQNQKNRVFKDTINSLIKNQEKIIQKLKEKK